MSSTSVWRKSYTGLRHISDDQISLNSVHTQHVSRKNYMRELQLNQLQHRMEVPVKIGFCCNARIQQE
jgi:hypothetical protein